MVGCVNKIIAKVLARILQKVMNSRIGPLQSSFIEGRQILDGALVTGEQIDSCRRLKSPVTIFKLDFHKVFDNVSWNFLHWVIEQMNFPLLWHQ